jgi:hypothetical protein
MIDTMRSRKLSLDLSAVSDQELERIIAAAFEEFARREERRKQRAIETVLVTAAEAGMAAREKRKRRDKKAVKVETNHAPTTIDLVALGI